jgi:large subunit ribosomal protein L17
MKHGTKTKKLGRTKDQREALMASLVESLIQYEQITTTEAKAKALRPIVEKLITKSKTDTVANRRLVLSRLKNRKPTTKKLFDEIGPRYSDRSGGYTRVIKLPPRSSDAAPMAVIQLV